MMKKAKAAVVCILIALMLAMVFQSGITEVFIKRIYPETVISMERLLESDSAIKEFDMDEDGFLVSTTFDPWIYIDYTEFGVVRPHSLDFWIEDMECEDEDAVFYFVESYEAQTARKTTGQNHLDLTKNQSTDRGLRLDLTALEGQRIKLEKIVFNDTSYLTGRYTASIRAVLFSAFLIMLGFGVYLWGLSVSKFAENGKIRSAEKFIRKHHLQMPAATLALLVSALCCFPGGAAWIGYVILYLSIFTWACCQKNVCTEYKISRKFLSSLFIFVMILAVFAVVDKYDHFCQILFCSDAGVKLCNLFVLISVAVSEFFMLHLCQSFRYKRDRKQNNSWIKEQSKGMDLCFMAAGLVVMYLLLEIVTKWCLGNYSMLDWRYFFRYEIFSVKTVLNILLLMAVCLIPSWILGYAWGKVLFGIIYVVILVGNPIKMYFQDELLNIADIYVIGEFAGIIGAYINRALIIILCVIIAALTVLAVAKRKWIAHHLRPHFEKSIIIMLPLLIVFFSFLNTEYFEQYGISKGKNYLTEASAEEADGVVVYYYYMFTTGVRTQQPDGYGEEIVSEVDQYVKAHRNDADLLSGEETDEEAGVTPDVILVLAESLFEVDKMPDLVFNIDLFEPVRQYMGAHVISPAYGGRTAAAEFESLTGFSNYFFQESVIAYTTYLTSPKNQIGSLAREFSDAGYTSIAMHPNRPDYYNRDVAYECMGFDEFISLDGFDTSEENMTGDDRLKDSAFFERMIEELQRADEEEESVFIFGITIEGHSPYGDKYDETTVKAYSDVYSESELEELEKYGQSVSNFSSALATLFDYLDTRTTPTLVYVYGDHLPPLSVYSTNGYIDDTEAKYTTPLITYSNYTTIDIGTESISIAQIAPQIIMDSGIPHRSYFDFLYQFREINPVLQKNFPVETGEELDLYEKIQYDMIFGKDYLLRS